MLSCIGDFCGPSRGYFRVTSRNRQCECSFIYQREAPPVGVDLHNGVQAVVVDVKATGWEAQPHVFGAVQVVERVKSTLEDFAEDNGLGGVKDFSDSPYLTKRPSSGFWKRCSAG